MKPQVESKLSTIFTYPFFQSVGKPVPSVVTILNSWPVAIKYYNSQKWQNCRLMARNVLHSLAEQKSWDRSQEWNPLIDELQPSIDFFVANILPKTGIPETIIAKIATQVSWDIKLICLEHHYSDVIDPPFYIPLLDPWYAAGHLPCGWDGDEFPEDWDGIIRDGKLMVF